MSRSSRLLGVISLLALAAVGASAQTCNSTVLTGLASQPDLELLSRIIGAFEPGGLALLSNSTFFAPTDGALYAIVASTGLAPGLTATNPSPYDVDLILGLLFYHVLPGKAYSQQALLNAGTLDTYLGQLEKNNYNLTFSQVGGALEVSGVPAGNTASITAIVPICTTGVIYKVDTALLPVADVTSLPYVNIPSNIVSAVSLAPTPVATTAAPSSAVAPAPAATTASPSPATSQPAPAAEPTPEPTPEPVAAPTAAAGRASGAPTASQAPAPAPATAAPTSAAGTAAVPLLAGAGAAVALLLSLC